MAGLGTVFEDYGDEDYVDNVSGVDELHAVNSFMKTMLLFCKREPPGDKSTWASERIAKELAVQKTNILAVIQAKHTLKQVTGKDQTSILNLYDEKGVYVGPTSTAKEKAELLSYALQEARRLDLEVVKTAYASGLYLFDPALDDDGDECNMQSTPEFKQAMHAYQTLRLVVDKLPSKLKRIAQSNLAMKEVRNLVLSVDALQIGKIQEVENARQALDRVEKIISSLERSITEQNLPELKKLLEQAIQMKMTRPIVEKARVKALELDIRNTLQTGMNTSDVKQLAAAIQFCMDAVMEEGVRRKRRKQRKLRTKWIMKKKGSSPGNNSSDDEKGDDSPDDDRHLSLNVDADIQTAQNFLRDLMKAAKEKAVNKPAPVPTPILDTSKLATPAATKTPAPHQAPVSPASPQLQSAIPLPNSKPTGADIKAAVPPSPSATAVGGQIPPQRSTRPPSIPSSPPPPPHPSNVDSAPNSAKSQLAVPTAANSQRSVSPTPPAGAGGSAPPPLSLTQPLAEPPSSPSSRESLSKSSNLALPLNRAGEHSSEQERAGPPRHQRKLSSGAQERLDQVEAEEAEIMARIGQQEELALQQMLNDANMALDDIRAQEEDQPLSPNSADLDGLLLRAGERTPTQEKQGEISRPVSTASLEDGSTTGGVLVGIVHPSEGKNKKRKATAREQARAQIRTAVTKAKGLLELLHNDQDRRLRATDLVTDIPFNPNINPAQVKGSEFLQLKLTIEAAIAAGAKVGIDADVDRMNVKIENLPEFAQQHGTAELSDFKDITELHNCLMEVDDQLSDWKRVCDQIKEIIRLIATCADENNPNADLEKLSDKVRYCLQTARLAVLDEEKVELIQAAFNALSARDAVELAQVLDDALDFVERENTALPGARDAIWPKSTLHEKNRAQYELNMSQTSASLAAQLRPVQPSIVAANSLPSTNLVRDITATARMFDGSSSFAAPSHSVVAEKESTKQGAVRLGELVNQSEEDKRIFAARSAAASPVAPLSIPSQQQAAPKPQGEDAPFVSPRDFELQSEGPSLDDRLKQMREEELRAAREEAAAAAKKRKESEADNTTADFTTTSFAEHRARIERSDSKKGAAIVSKEGDAGVGKPVRSGSDAARASPAPGPPTDKSRMASPPASIKGPKSPPPIKPPVSSVIMADSKGSLGKDSVPLPLPKEPEKSPLSSAQLRQQAALDKHKRNASHGAALSEKDVPKQQPQTKDREKESKTRPPPLSGKKPQQNEVPTGKSVDREMADTAELLFKLSVPDEEEKKAAAQGHFADFPKANSIARKNLTEIRAIVAASLAAAQHSVAGPTSNSSPSVTAPSSSSQQQQANKSPFLSAPGASNAIRGRVATAAEEPEEPVVNGYFISPAMPTIVEASPNSTLSRGSAQPDNNKNKNNYIQQGVTPLQLSNLPHGSHAAIPLSPVASPTPFLSPRHRATEQLSKTLVQATRLLRALMANLQAVSACKDLITKPAPNTPMRRGRVRDSDLSGMKAKVQNDLAMALQNGLDENSKEVSESHNVLAEIDVHEEERSAAAAMVEQLLAESAKYPFATGDGVNEEMDLYPQDEALHSLRERVAETLQNARLVGIVEDHLTPLQDTHDDMLIYIAGRNEARSECEKLLKMVKTLYDAHPMMFKVEELETAIAQHASENDFKNLESEPVDQADSDLVGVADLLNATLADTELVGIPQSEPSIASCRSALTALRTYITARVAARQEIQSLADAPMHQMLRRRIRSALQFAKKTGLLNDDDIMKAQRHLGRGGQQITRSQTLRRIDLLAKRLVELEKNKKPVQQPNIRQKLEDLDRLDKKLTSMVPEARRRLAQAIKDKDPEALAAAIQQAKALELKLQKLREYRKQELEKLNSMGYSE